MREDLSHDGGVSDESDDGDDASDATSTALDVDGKGAQIGAAEAWWPATQTIVDELCTEAAQFAA